jgi:SAM-dependent methyltransferase
MGNTPPFPSMPFMAGLSPLLRLFRGVLRRGPGSEASTLRALALCPLPDKPVVADLGCGSGASALLLAPKLQVPILALDADGLALDNLWERSQVLGLLDLIQPRCGDMADPGIAPVSLDLLWSEGAISLLGWARGLRLWRELLRPGGVMAVTDATWLMDDPPEEARSAWATWYPEMGTRDRNLGVARELGLEPLAHFDLHSEDWWAYLRGTESRCNELKDCAELADCIAGMRREIELYRQHGHSYGYVFYILKRV